MEKWRITSNAMYIPLIVTKTWLQTKIVGVMKAHVHGMKKLGQIFIQNIGDIDQPLVWKDGRVDTLRLTMVQVKTSNGQNLIHSLHKTNNKGTI